MSDTETRNRKTDPAPPRPRQAVTIRVVLDLSYELQPEEIEVPKLEQGVLTMFDVLSGNFAPLEHQGALVGINGMSATMEPEEPTLEHLHARMVRAALDAYARAAEPHGDSFRTELDRALAPVSMELAAAPVRTKA